MCDHIMADISARCRIKICNNNSANYHGGFFKFPKDMERAELWAYLCGLEDVLKSSKNHTNIKICGAHFRPEMFSSERGVRRRLLPKAYPTMLKLSAESEVPRWSEETQEVTILQAQPGATVCLLDEGQISTDDVGNPVLSLPGTSTEVMFLADSSCDLTHPDISLPGPSRASYYSDETQDVIISEVDLDSGDESIAVHGVETPCKTPEPEMFSTPSTSRSASSSSNVYSQTPKEFSRTPRKLKYRQNIKALHQKIRYYQKKLQQVQNKSSLHQDEKTLFLTLVDKYLKREQAAFIRMQVQHDTRSAKGRRYTEQFKKMCLSLYFKGPSAYRHLSNIFTLPTKRTLNRMTQKIVLEPGIQEKIFTSIEAKVKNFSSLEKYCALIIDEMSLKGHTFYNITQDEIIGFEDCGDGKVMKPALYATVFMLRGISSNWKQPVGYYFVNSSCTVNMLLKGLEKIEKYATEIGLKLCLVITDQGSNFVSLAKTLGVSHIKPYFHINNTKIIYMFDPPHLLKSIRNNLLKCSFLFNGKSASWDHIIKFYNLDKAKNNRYAHRLSEQHVNPSSFDKMKVKYAAQILSASVAVGMEIYLAYGELPPKASGTIELIDLFDKLFDLFNSRSNACPKMYNRVFTNQEYQSSFLTEAYNFLSNIKIIKAGKDISSSVKCVFGWMQAIRGLSELWTDLSSSGFSYFKTNWLNQDCLENFFGSIRQQGGNCFTPTPIQFMRAFKKHFVIDFMHSGTENCENDFSSMLLTMEEFSSCRRIDDTETTDEVTVEIEILVNTTDYDQFNVHEENSLQYICGSW